MVDLNPDVQNQAQITIQHIVERLQGQYAGEDVERVMGVLSQEIADAGIPEQPEKFVRDTAAEIAAGRTIVVDRAAREEDDPRRH